MFDCSNVSGHYSYYLRLIRDLVSCQYVFMLKTGLDKEDEFSLTCISLF